MNSRTTSEFVLKIILAFTLSHICADSNQLHAESFTSSMNPEWCVDRKYPKIDSVNWRITDSLTTEDKNAHKLLIKPVLEIEDKSSSIPEANISPDGKMLMIANQGIVSFLSTRDYKVLFSVEVGAKPKSLYWSKSRGFVVAEINEPGTFRNECLFLFDIDSNIVIGSYPETGNYNPFSLMGNEETILYTPQWDLVSELSTRTGKEQVAINGLGEIQNIVTDENRYSIIGSRAVYIAQQPNTNKEWSCSLISKIRNKFIREYFKYPESYISRLETSGRFWKFAFGTDGFIAATDGGEIIISNNCADHTSLNFKNRTIWSVAASKEKNLYAAAIRDTVILIDGKKQEIVSKLTWQGRENEKVEFALNGTRMLVYQEHWDEDVDDEYFVLLNIENPASVIEMGRYYRDGSQLSSRSILLSPDFDKDETDFILIDLSTGKEKSVDCSNGKVWLDPKGNYLATLCGGQGIVYNTQTDKIHFQFNFPGASDIKFSQDGTLLLVARRLPESSKEHLAIVFDLKNAEEIARLQSIYPLWNFEFGPLGKHILGSGYKHIILWRIPIH